MNIFIFDLFLKIINIVLTACLVNTNYVSTNVNNYSLQNKTTNLGVYNTIIDYNTIYKYTSRRPKGIEIVVSKGEKGYLYQDLEQNSTRIVKSAKDEIKEIGVGREGTFNGGSLTGYGPDCEGCSLVGNVACFTKNRKNHSLITDGIYYNDDEFGQVRILAATFKVFPCGTIVHVDNGILPPFYGVVLDTGGAMREAYSEENKILMDLAFTSEKIAFTAGATSRGKTTFNVQRWGW